MKYVLDTHSHTIASGHAYNTIAEMAKAASKKGLELLAITEHSKMMPGSCKDIYFSNLSKVEREQYGVKLWMGVELNIMDYEGNIDMPERILKNMELVIASLHTPCIKPGNIEENTSAVIGAMKNPYIHIIGHLDDAGYPVDYERIVQTAKETGTILEVNNNSLSPDCFRANSRNLDAKMMKLCMDYEVPVVVGSDAHAAHLVGSHEYAYSLMKEIGFPKELVLNRSVDMLKKAMKSKKNK